MVNLAKATEWFFTDKDGKLAIMQFPNLPLTSWIVFTIATHLVQSDPAHTVMRIAAFISLFIWALLEIASGLSPFRRVLGAVILILLITSLL